MDSSTAASQPRLKRRLGVFGNILLTLSGVSPAASVFVIAPEAISEAGTGAFWGFTIAAVIGIFVAMCFAELSSAFPVAAGDYAFAARAIGKGPGFAMLVFDTVKALFIICVIAYGTAQYLQVVVPGLDDSITATAVILITTILGVFNIRFGAIVTGIFLLVEMAAISIVVWLGFSHPKMQFSEMIFNPQVVGGDGTLHGVALGVIAGSVATALFSYNGYQNAVIWSEETHGASTNVAKAIFQALIVTVLAELIPLTAVIIGTSSIPDLLAAENPMRYLIVSLSNEHVYTAVSLGIAVAIFNAVLVLLLALGRVLYCTGRDRVWPTPINKALGEIHPKFGSPAKATILAGLVAAVCTMLIPFETLVLLGAGGIVVTYVFAAVGVIFGRITGRTAHAPYRMRFWIIAPTIVLLASGYLLVVQDTAPKLVAIGLCLVGLLYYLVYLRPRPDTRWILVDADEDESTQQIATPTLQNDSLM